MTIPGNVREGRFLDPFQAQFLSKTQLFTESLEDISVSLTFPGSRFHNFSSQKPKQGTIPGSFLCVGDSFLLSTLNYFKVYEKGPSYVTLELQCQQRLPLSFVLNQIPYPDDSTTPVEWTGGHTLPMSCSQG